MVNSANLRNFSIPSSAAKKEKKQEAEIKRHWPIIGPEVMGPYDCLDAVDNTVNVALITASKLP